MNLLENSFKILEEKIQLLIMNFTKIKEKNEQLLENIEKLNKKNFQQEKIIESMNKKEKEFELVKENIRKKIEILIKQLILDLPEKKNNIEFKKIKKENNNNQNEILFKDDEVNSCSEPLNQNILSKPNINFLSDED